MKVNSGVEWEWLWLVGNWNPAKLGTSPTAATPESLCVGSEYQEGMAWIKEPMDKWACKKSFGPVPGEEMRKAALCNTISKAPIMGKGHLPFPSPTRGGLERLLRVCGYVFAPVYK